MDASAEVLSDNRRAQDEFTLQLVDALTPSVLQGFTSILEHAVKLCEEQGEEEKYLMMFQNMLARIPSWSSSTISEEVERIAETSQIGYLPDLVTAVHIIHLRILSSVRVGHKPKRIEIDPPDFDQFVHRVYCEAGRKMWTYAYLFRRDVPALDHQRNMHECEKIVRDCVVSAIRASLPVESILRAYIDEAEEIRLSALEEAKESLEKAKDGVQSKTGVDGGADGDGTDAGAGASASESASTDVESEVKQITASALPGSEPPTLRLDTGDLPDESDDDGDDGETGAGVGAEAAPAPEDDLSVGFAEKNEVLDMGTNRTAPVAMSPGPRSPAPLPGPPLQEVTLDSLLGNTAQPPPLSHAAPPSPRAALPTMRLDTSPLA